MKKRTIYIIGAFMAFAFILAAGICMFTGHETAMITLEFIAATIISVILTMKFIQWMRISNSK